MARHRKREEERTRWQVGRYIRLSRDDGGGVSESVVNQDKILSEAIETLFEAGTYEVVDTYVDGCAIIGLRGARDRAAGVCLSQ